jgi:hypothetical protein
MVKDLRPEGLRELQRRLGSLQGPASRLVPLFDWLREFEQAWEDTGAMDRQRLTDLEHELLPLLNALPDANESRPPDLPST